ncbi:AzlD domain-containing protein [Desulfovibrio sp. OttesenSCG-928-C06]|nr:AzlD domain-containing protein [Desulfovibrio sp. OttesenSCG-928-C06]
MSVSPETLLLILGMCLVTFIPRFLPMLLLSSRSLNPQLERWLKLVPPAVLAALLAPELLTSKGGAEGARLFISPDNMMLLASIPCFITAWITKSFFGTIVVGMAALALLRFFLG